MQFSFNQLREEFILPDGIVWGIDNLRNAQKTSLPTIFEEEPQLLLLEELAEAALIHDTHLLSEDSLPYKEGQPLATPASEDHFEDMIKGNSSYFIYYLILYN